MALQLQTYLPRDAIFDVTSTLIYGEREAILVDAQFQASRAQELVDLIKATGRTLTTIFISHSDPDYYFGLDTIHRAFPDARIVSTPQTAWLIEASRDNKLAVWGEKLGADAPKEFITPEPVTGTLDLEGETIEIRQAKDDPGHAFLWVPSLKAVVGGIMIFAGSHPWLADTPDLDALDQWIARLDDMIALKPEKVVPAHIAGDKTDSPEVLRFLRGYLKDWREAAATAKGSGDIIEAMEAKYPDLSGKDSLEMGAKVFQHEMPWEVATLYPLVGRKAVVDFGDFKFELDFEDNRQMTFRGLTDSTRDLTDTVDYTAVSVRPDVYMVYWSEPNTTGANVVHVQDFEAGTVWTNIAGKDGSFTNLKGKLTPQG